MVHPHHTFVYSINSGPASNALLLTWISCGKQVLVTEQDFFDVTQLYLSRVAAQVSMPSAYRIP